VKLFAVREQQEALKMPEGTGPKAKKEKQPKKPAAAKAAGKKPTGAKTASRKAAGARPVKGSAARTKPAEKRLSRVPEEYVFYCCDGGVYRDLAELAAGLAAMTDATFAYHSNRERQDFCNWVRDVVQDIELANQLAMAESRDLAAVCVAERINLLSR
jgi:hypothetical protein